MSDVRELYQEMILEHNKTPRNFLVLKEANRKAEGYNPLCGDRLTVYLLVEKDVIKDISFQGSGCAISKASASMMTAILKGKKVAEAEEIFHQFHDMLSKGGLAGADRSKLGKLTVFSGVCDYPVRVKCATLAWHTLNAGLKNEAHVISTEDKI